MPPSNKRPLSKKPALVNQMGQFVKLWNLSKPVHLTFQSTDLKIISFTFSGNDSCVKLEQDSSSLNFQFCKNALGPILSRPSLIPDSKDTDNELFLSQMQWHRNWVKISLLNCAKIFLFLIAHSDVESAVNEHSMFYYLRWWWWNWHCVNICMKSCEYFLFLRLKY